MLYEVITLYYKQARSQITAVKNAQIDMDPLQAIGSIGGVNAWVMILAWIVYGLGAIGVIAAIVTGAMMHQ